MLINIATTGYDMENPKRKNSLWDMDIAAVAGTDHVIESGPILLVTNEDMIVRACKSAGCGQNVLKTADYLDSIGAAVVD
ncbi:MAG: hypothetical protein HYX78_08015 [Armatimonadetes bacterium]|nr:hypothetical protein [Armatimonadota bacterium]